MKKLITGSLLALSAVGVQAETTKQVGLMTDSLFRGMTETDNGIAVYLKATKQIDNAYAGISFVNIDAPSGAEGVPVKMNVNFGYNNKFDNFNIDIEVITYNYLVDSQRDETEFKIGTSLTDNLDLAFYRGIKNKTWYSEIVYEKFLTNRLYLDATAGYWIKDGADDDALTARVELGRDFPELYGIDIYAAVDFTSDSTPFGNDSDEDESELEYVLGVRKNF